jgi:hypothetical protein
MASQALKAIPYIIGQLLLASSHADAQRNCGQAPFPDTSSVDAIFLARLTATEPYTEMVSIDDQRSSWPMVRLYLQPYYGWKINPQTVTYPWFPMDSSMVVTSVLPLEDPRLPDNSWVLVYMKIGYSQVIVIGDSTPHPLKGDKGILQLVSCGLRLSSDTSLGSRLYGRSRWHWESP